MNYCILNDTKICDNCGECNRCDLDPKKVCDNCCKCIENSDNEYRELNLADYLNLTDRVETPTELTDWSLENAHYEPSDFLESVDPALMAEWEKKLKESEIKELRSKIKTLPVNVTQRKKK